MGNQPNEPNQPNQPSQPNRASRAERPKWYEIVLEASADEVETLLAEVAAPAGEKPLVGRDLHLPPAAFGDRLRGLLGGRFHQVVFAGAGAARELLRAAGSRPGVRLDSLREIDRGSFSFRAEVYSRELAGEIRHDLMADLPAGIELADAGDAEEVHPEDRGVELYTLAHDYVCHLRGTLSGPLPEILEMWRRSHELDFLHEEDLRLDGRDVAPESV